MSHYLAALRSAQGAILVAHMFKTLFAFVVLGGFGVQLARVASGGDLVQLATFTLQEAPRHAAEAQWAVCGYALVGPLLTQFVLAALLERGRPKTAAMWRYGRALGLSLARFVALGLAAWAAFAASMALAISVPPALETAARLSTLALGAAVLVWLATVHDLAAAQLAASERPRVATAIGDAVRAGSLRVAVMHLTFMLAAVLAYAAGELANRALWPALGLAVSQAFALAVAFVHAGWLSFALVRINQLFLANQKQPA